MVSDWIEFLSKFFLISRDSSYIYVYRNLLQRYGKPGTINANKFVVNNYVVNNYQKP
jgi:hypothetical protein